MSYARRVAYNTIVQVVGRIVTTITSLATVSILNGTLEPSGWGTYVAITTYLGFFAVIADMGLNLLYLREISREPDHVEAITARFFGFRLTSAIIVLLGLAPLIALLVPVYHAQVIPIILLALGQLMLTLNQTCVTIVQARLQMDRAIFSDIVGRIVIFAGTAFAVTTLPSDQRLLGAVAVVGIGNAINLCVSYFLVRKMVRLRVTFDLRAWPGIFVQVLPMGALAVLGMIHFKADSVLLTLYRPAYEVGIYGNAYKILEILITLPGMFIGGLFPEMNQLFKKDIGELRALMQKAFDLLLFAVIPVVVGIALLAPQLIGILTRNYVGESARSLQVLAFAMIPLFIGTLMTHALITGNRQKQLSIVELVAVVLNIGLNLYLIPRYTYYGAASATVTSEVFTTIVTTWITARVLGFLPSLRTLWPALAGSLLMYGLYLGVSTGLGGAWFQDYFAWSRAAQSVLLSMVIIGGTIAYILPFAIFRAFPPVIQQRLIRSRA